MRKYLRFNYILGAIVLLLGLSKLLEPIELLRVVGIMYYIVTAIALIKKPNIGYVLLIVSIVGLALTYLINYYVNSY